MTRRRSPADFTDFELGQIRRRDFGRCVVCGSTEVTTQHRVAKGSGGLGTKAVKLTPADGLLLCYYHNADAEGRGQERAKRCGWKVIRFSSMPCDEIPYYDAVSGNWYLPDVYGGRRWVDPGWAAEQVRLANELP